LNAFLRVQHSISFVKKPIPEWQRCHSVKPFYLSIFLPCAYCSLDWVVGSLLFKCP